MTPKPYEQVFYPLSPTQREVPIIHLMSKVEEVGPCGAEVASASSLARSQVFARDVQDGRQIWRQVGGELIGLAGSCLPSRLHPVLEVIWTAGRPPSSAPTTVSPESPVGCRLESESCCRRGSPSTLWSER